MRQQHSSIVAIVVMLAVAVGGAGGASADSTSCVTDSKLFLILDSQLGMYAFDTFSLMADGGSAQIWVQDDLSWPAGDPRATPVVTCDQAAYLLSEVESNVIPVQTASFGPPDSHDGSASLLEAWGYFPSGYFFDSEGRQIVLVENIRDDNYYDPTHLPFTPGFYAATFEQYFDRNIVTIDAFEWQERLGPDGAQPYFYERVAAREYHHLLHDDYDPDEVTFVVEGLSELAAFLSGYGPPADAVAAVESHPENSLVVWGDQGPAETDSDLGHAFLFQLFLLERYGIDSITAEFLSPDNGMPGIDAALAALLLEDTFADVYHDFRIALLIDDEQWKGGRYGFAALDVDLDIGTLGSPNPEAYSVSGAPPWGTDYVWLDGDPHGPCKFIFNGVDYTSYPSGWTSDGLVLWSGDGDLIDAWAIFSAAGGGTLSFDTYWDIEDSWDFGFVQVSTDGGSTWSSLGNASTTAVHDPSAHPDIIANLPGLTGWSVDWLNVEFDLSPYAGQDILLALRYMTDWTFTLDGWFVDNVTVDGTLISDGSDASVFDDITGLFPIENDFIVTIVGFVQKGNGTKHTVHTLKLDEVTEEGMAALNGVLNQADGAVLLVTSAAPEGVADYAQYTYSIDVTGGGPKP